MPGYFAVLSRWVPPVYSAARRLGVSVAWSFWGAVGLVSAAYFLGTGSRLSGAGR